MIRGTNDAPYRTMCSSASRQNCSVSNPVSSAAARQWFRRATVRSAPVSAPKSLLLGALAVFHLGGVLVVELDIALVAAREHVDRVLDLAGILVALAGVSAVTLLAKVDLLALEGGRVREFLDDTHEQRDGVARQVVVGGLGQRLAVELLALLELNRHHACAAAGVGHLDAEHRGLLDLRVGRYRRL